MEINLNVEGMMCSGCENRVQNALKEVEGVTNVVANHTSKKVTITTNGNVDESKLKEIIEDLGYEVK